MNTDIIKSFFDRPSRIEPDTMSWMRNLLGTDPFREMQAIGAAEMTFWPKVEVRESDKAYHFALDVPGVNESDLDVSLVSNRLTISGKREAIKTNESDTLYARERHYGSFTRAFTLPVGVDTENVLASLEDGVLHVTLPKLMEATAKKIAVKKSVRGRAS